MRPARTINYTALGWTAVAALAAIALILLVPLAWHLTVALWTSGAAWWLAAVAAVLIIGGLLLTGYTYRDRIAELEAEAERRDREHEAEVRDLRTDLSMAYESLDSVLNEHALCPAPVRRLSVVEDISTEGHAAIVDLMVGDARLRGHIPRQREHLPLSSEEWDAITRETEWPS